jgi:hypothetical protein
VLAKTLIDPDVPAATIAAFAFTRPSLEFISELPGLVSPVGHTVRKPRGPFGATVTLSE